jgi:hypothetical protein
MTHLEPFVQWLFTNVIAALFPIAVGILSIKLWRIDIRWHAVLRDGELFVFSSTLSITALSASFFSQLPRTLANSLIVLSLFVVLGISTLFYGAAILAKLTGASSNANEEMIATGSILCASLVVLLSSYVFVISGGL